LFERFYKPFSTHTHLIDCPDLIVDVDASHEGGRVALTCAKSSHPESSLVVAPIHAFGLPFADGDGLDCSHNTSSAGV
jgi:hypothetical protein